MSDVTLKFGKRLQRIRKTRKLTQAQLAELVGLEVMTISRIENGVQFPKPENLEKFAKVLKINLKELFDFDNYTGKKAIVKELCEIINNSGAKDLEFYKKIILAHLEYS